MKTDIHAMRGITVGEGRFWLGFPFDAALVKAVKEQLQGARYDGRARRWWVPGKLAFVPALLDFAQAHNFTLGPELKQWIARERAEAKRNLVESRATDADLVLDGLGGELDPYQRAGVLYLVRNRRVILADEMGLGKTVQALAALRALNALPAVVVCPASLRWNWEREAKHWLPGITTEVLESGDTLRGGAKLTIVNYDILGNFVEGLRALDPQAVICDESHYLKNSKTKRFTAAKALLRGQTNRMLLTGTPMENRPQELIAPLQLLDRLDDFGGFWHFAHAYCGAQKKSYGWDLSGIGNKEAMAQLAARLRATCLIRRLKRDVLQELPAKRRVIVPVPLSNAAEYREAQRDLVGYIQAKAQTDPAFARRIAGMDEDAQVRELMRVAKAAAQRAERSADLVRLTTLLGLSAAGKVAAVKDWVESFLESGESLILFGNRREVVEGLAAHFKVPCITGDTEGAERQRIVDAFQAGKNRLIVCNLKAGGVGFTMTRASNVAFIEGAWNPALLDQAEDRAHRKGQRNAVTAWYFLGRGTVDWHLHEVANDKRELAREVNGDLKVTMATDPSSAASAGKEKL